MITLLTKNNIVMQELQHYLDKKSYYLLELYYKGFTLQEMITKLNIPRKQILLNFIFLGKQLMRYELDCKVIPKSGNEEYLKGFNECKQTILGYKKKMNKRFIPLKRGKNVPKR